MPPDTNWSGNTAPIITPKQGNIGYDDANTTYDSSTTYYDGTAPVNLIPIYTPKNTLWTEQTV